MDDKEAVQPHNIAVPCKVRYERRNEDSPLVVFDVFFRYTL